jgi:apolipoprotein N-acyltransferase
LSSRLSAYALALASGVLLALSFPKFGHPALAWIALAPLLAALTRTTMRRAFTLGLVTGIVYFTGTLYWITRVMVMYGDLTLWVAVLDDDAHPERGPGRLAAARHLNLSAARPRRCRC